MPDRAAEQAKWDSFYRDQPLVHLDDEQRALNDQLVSAVTELLPGGGRVLEAGCGAGWASLALASTGRFHVTLLDFSSEALHYARRVFERAGQPAEFRLADMADAGEPEFDLVFNAGVLEHYSAAEQSRLLASIARRSRRYVLALVPNPRCYWYWVWRRHITERGEWRWGTEVPPSALAGAFESAGLRFLGHRYFGEASTEYFIRTVTGVGSPVCEEILAAHRSPLVALDQRAYLIAGLGSVSAEPVAVAGWDTRETTGAEADQMRAALVDALAMRVTAETEMAALRGIIAESEAEVRRLRDSNPATTLRLSQIEVSQTELLGEMRQARAGALEERDKLRQEAARLAAALAAQEKSNALAAAAHAERERNWNRESEALDHERAALKDKLRDTKEALTEARRAVERSQQTCLELTGAVERQRKSVREARAARIEQERSAAQAITAYRVALAQAESLRKQTLGAFANLSEELTRKLREYRGQRAWQVMLAIREAYTRWTRGENGGKLGALGVPLALMNRSLDLSRQDLTFPDPWQYAPHELRTSLARNLAIGVPTARPRRRYDVVILSIVDFEFRYQRPQQLAVRMAREGHRVYWISPTRRPGDRSRFELSPLRENLWELRIPGVPVDLYGGELSWHLAETMLAGLDEFYRSQGISESCAYLQFPFWRKLAVRMRERFGARIAYDMMDDWEHWATPPLIGEPVLADERELFRETDCLIVTARAFAERHSGNVPAPVLVPNGADYDFFHSARSEGYLDTVKRPIIGYFGAISTWFDMELLTEVVKLRPGYSFVLIGQVHEVDPAEMRASANVAFLGEQSYQQLPGYLHDFDVCLIPFRMNKVIEGVDPVKMYEYFSQGKPVVATPMRELESLGDLIYLAGTPEEFAAAIDRALAEPSDLPEKRLEYARRHTWTERARRIDAALTQAWPLVSILVVTYNSIEFLEPFLESIERNTTYPNYEVIIVDNHSSDGSAEFLEQSHSDRVRAFTLESNLGFAGGNNFAAKQARGQWLVVLNPDTLVTPGWVGRLMAPLLAETPDGRPVGMTAPVTNFSGNETKINFDYTALGSMETFAAWLAREQRGRTLDLENIPLLCAMLSRTLWDELGGLDERYTVGMFEDDDLCIRVRQAGFRIVTAEDCFIHHFGNGSFQKLDPGESLRIFEENRARYEEKWGIAWQPHKYRAGVRPVPEDRRFNVADFVAGGLAEPEAPAAPPILIRLHPRAAVAGEIFHPQPGGMAALAVECERVTPSTLIQFGDELLATAFANGNLLTGLLRPELLALPRTVVIRLVNDQGSSEPRDFVIAPQ